MAWTTFANLTSATTVELDNNLSILTLLANVDCTASGTNALALTVINGGTAIAAYQQNLQIYAIAANTNSGATTAALGSLAALPVYKDTQTGPVALTGGEIVQNCLVGLWYDAALNGASGGFHLMTGGPLVGQTFSVTGITASSFFYTAGVATLASIIASNMNAGGVVTLSSLSIAGGDAAVRLNSTLVSVIYASTLVPGAYNSQTISLTGVAVGDNIVVGLSSVTPASISFAAYAGAAGSVILRASNATPSSTITLVSTLSMRITDLGFAT